MVDCITTGIRLFMPFGILFWRRIRTIQYNDNSGIDNEWDSPGYCDSLTGVSPGGWEKEGTTTQHVSTQMTACSFYRLSLKPVEPSGRL